MRNTGSSVHRFRRAVFAIVLLLAAPSAAQEVSSAGDDGSKGRAFAEALFRDAKQLLKKGKPAEACPKLEESQRIDPGGGTQLLLGLCLEQTGKTASAWVELNEALAWAQRDGNEARATIAREHLAELESRLSKVQLVIPEEARVDGLAISYDGTGIPRAAWTTAFPVDPGHHVLSLRAPDHRPADLDIAVEEEGVTKEVELPALEPQPSSPTEKAAPPPPKTASPSRAETAPATDPSPSNAASGRKTWGYVVGATGLATLAAGGGFGIHALSLKNRVDEACPQTTCDRPDLEDDLDRAGTSATVSTILTAIGAAEVAVGVYLLLTSSAQSNETAQSPRAPLTFGRTSFDMTPLREGAALQLRGKF